MHKPMYLFLGNMAVADIVACTSSVPKQLQILLTGDTKILYESCLVQIFSVHVFGNLESLILLGVLVLIWVISTSACMILPLLVTRLNFSDDNRKIQGILCDHMGVVVLAESDIKVNNAYGTVQMVLLFLLPLIFISYSYLRIFIECRIKRSAEITKHGLNTLLTHFLALLIFFICTLGSIMIPRYFKDLKTPTVLNFGILAIPMSNALIYFFRTKELRKGIMKSCQHIFLLRTLFPKF
uniref:G-protein coupled receptors family 1 profile domain-containing protein n=1 Tax=Petromyzon marinus TaxID=7757 RepID=S4RPH3_PETMA